MQHSVLTFRRTLRRALRLALAASLVCTAAAAQSFTLKPATTPDPGPFVSIFAAVTAPSDDEAWAVGDFLDAGAIEKTLAARFDGSVWSVVPSANLGTQQDDLTGVAAAVPGDVWAVGGSMNTNGSQTTLVQHFDGTQFVVVPSPNPTGPTGNSRLNAAVALASNNVWAVGEFIATGVDILPLVEHWDGTSWTIVPGPNAPGVYFMWGIAAVGPNDIWAVGESDGVHNHTYAMHWNGIKWSTVPTPTPVGSSDSKLKGVGCSPSGEVWAVGSFDNEQVIAERWNGSVWTLMPALNVNNQDRLFGVSVRSPGDVIMVGSLIMGNGNQKSVVEWYDGSTFHLVPSPNPFASNTPLAIAAPPCGPQWIAGGGDQPPALKTLAIRITGPGGPVTDLGGGCGAGGNFAVVGPVSMGSNIALQLAGADPAASLALLNIAITGAPTTCGPCALLPYQITVLLPLAAGAVSLPAAVPCGSGFLGLSVAMQWTVGPTASTGCALLGSKRAVSNVVQITLGD